jgi:hypothetical protein
MRSGDDLRFASRRPCLTITIPAEPDRQDEVVIRAVAPVARGLQDLPGDHEFDFERLNKPSWRVGLTLRGPGEWLEEVGRPFLEERLAKTKARGDIPGFAFEAEASDEKWLGRPRDRSLLARFSFVDSLAALAVLENDVGGESSPSRAEWSLLVVEGLLDRFSLSDEDRLEFYREGFQWAVEMGRWDKGVLAALEGKYQAEADALGALLDHAAKPASLDALWKNARAVRIARSCLDAQGAPIAAIVAQAGTGRLDRTLRQIAGFAVRGHSNRLGIHATQEAVMRYLVWRARGGRQTAHGSLPVSP